MKYIRLIATFSLMMFAAHLSDHIYTVSFKQTYHELSDISAFGCAILTWLPRLIFGVALGVNWGRISNWIWGVDDEF